VSAFIEDLSNVFYVPLSHRYGFASMEATARWQSRHSSKSGHYPAEELLRCICPASGTTLTDSRCLERASQEDRLCDACREHCWAVDNANGQHRLVDVYGAAS
jgi:hypothetical protein